MDSKDKTISFLAGFITGTFSTFIFLGILFGLYKVAAKVGRAMYGEGQTYVAAEPAASKALGRTASGSKGSGRFRLSFENAQDLSFFEATDGVYTEQSNDNATDGKRSLLAEYPQGAQYPSLAWEVYKKEKCLDLNGAGTFAFDVYNNSEVNVVLNVKLKSGAQYPKKTYETTVNLPAQGSHTCALAMSELRNNLDIGEISYIKLFVMQPQENITLYFDNVRAE